MNQIVTIRDRRQVTIPSKFLRSFGLDVGDKFLIKLESDQILLEPIKVKTVDLLSKIQQVIQESDISVEELQKNASNLRRENAKR